MLALTLMRRSRAARAEEKKNDGSWSSARARAISTSRSRPRWSRSTTSGAARASGTPYFRTDCTAITKKPLKWGAKNLNDFDAVVFFTDGDLDMDDSQKADLLSFVRDDGKGFIGIHSAAITFTRPGRSTARCSAAISTATPGASSTPPSWSRIPPSPA